MFNLNDILQSAQGGQAINNLAQRFGLSPEQTQAAVQALIPALSTGLSKAATNPGTLGSIISSVADGDHQASFSSPDAAQSPAATQKGSDALSQILGSSHIVQQIAQQASSVTGIRADVLVQMLPAVASIVLGGLAASLHNQGLGGILGQLATAAEQGNLGGVLGSAGANAGGGGLMSMLTSILGGLFGGAAGGTSGAGSTSGAAGSTAVAGASPALTAGIEALTKMFQTGSLPASVTQSGLQDSISKILSGGRP